jgi:DNA-binding GntR family transcriptional regulator
MTAHRNYRFDEFVSRKCYALDASFHLKIAEAGKNINLWKLLKQILEQIYLRHRIEGITTQRLKDSPLEHQGIFDAIKERKLTKAQSIMRRHIAKGKKAAMVMIEKNQQFYEF